MTKQVYRFRVGVKPLDSISYVGGTVLARMTGLSKVQATHVAILLGTDLFEYGPGGVNREKGFNRNGQPHARGFDWDRLGSKLNGTTYITPDELAGAIERSGLWKNFGQRNGYCPATNNCHTFVRFCLDRIGADHFYKGYDQMLMAIF